MKLRIHGNSLRLRLTRTEVASLGAGHSLHQTTEFSPQSRLVCTLEADSQVQRLVASFENGRIRVLMPLNEARDWANSERVGVEADQSIGSDRSLAILVEKDFECLHSRDQIDNDAFPNPRSK